MDMIGFAGEVQLSGRFEFKEVESMLHRRRPERQPPRAATPNA
jgi:hypothetical protein